MTLTARRLRRALRRGACGEDGSATVEFALVFPVFILFLLSSVEVGMLLMRQVMLDRGLDLAVRDLRLGAFDEEFAGPNGGTAPADAHRLLVEEVCRRALLVPNCLAELKLEMIVTDARAWRPLDPTPDCVDRANRGAAVREFEPGAQNQLMLLRVCALFDPFFPQSGLGFSWTDAAGGHYALVSTSAFVIEPNRDRT